MRVANLPLSLVLKFYQKFRFSFGLIGNFLNDLAALYA